MKQPTRILLIDDDEEDAEIFGVAVSEVSSKVSYSVMHNAREALNRLSAKELQPEIIFLDLNMPLMGGQSFLIEIKKNPELAGIPVIIFSTSSRASTIQHTKELGAHDFITKSESIDRLVEILKPILTP